MTRLFWTRDKEIELARRYVEGDSIDDICEAFGATHGMVKARLNMLGVRRRITKSAADRNGNAALLLGQALRTAMPVKTDGFADDLLKVLDTGNKA
ncbi:hypothetical protein [Sphingomonas abaci]|uniref:Uncharacterized protein n=1 Tax=Sphingomonas abaci TaxID=237611 RepID=A0A7W7APX6_9SPHN|nr:hypothetical protein [Sphingomonas abaci]MBB4620007.1 hypothetical protein [Sphingomonas abaci]